MDPIQSMPNLDSMVTRTFSAKEWLTYYKNVWTRNLAARTIDMMTDVNLKQENAEMSVNLDDGQEVPVKVRLEHRKILVQDAQKLLAQIDGLLANEDLEGSVWSDKFLAVAEDMLPPAKEEKKPEAQAAEIVPASEAEGAVQANAEAAVETSKEAAI